MSKAIPNKTISITDPDGTPVTGVILGNSEDICWIYTEDYERINAMTGKVRSWYVNTNGHNSIKYVRVKHLGNNFMVSRLVLGHQPRTAIKYRDGNRLNLRRSNLYVDFGRGASKTKTNRFRAALKIPVRSPSEGGRHV